MLAGCVFPLVLIVALILLGRKASLEKRGLVSDDGEGFLSGELALL